MKEWIVKNWKWFTTWVVIGLVPLIYAAVTIKPKPSPQVDLFKYAQCPAPDPRKSPQENLRFYAKRGCSLEVKYFLEQGVDPNYQDKYGSNALNSAAREGHYRVVQVLLDHGADPNIAKRAEGVLINTPLNAAGRRRHARVACLLMKRGASLGDVKKIYEYFSPEGPSPEEGKKKLFLSPETYYWLAGLDCEHLLK